MSVGHRTYILERLWNSNILVEWEEVGGGGRGGGERIWELTDREELEKFMKGPFFVISKSAHF